MIDRVLQGLAAGVEERGALLVVSGGDPVQRLGHRDVGLVGRGEEKQVWVYCASWAARAATTAGAALPTVVSRDAAAEVDEGIAVDVEDDAAAGGGYVDPGAAGQSGR